MSAPPFRKNVTAALVFFVVGGIAFTLSVAQFASSEPADELKEKVAELEAIVADLKNKVETRNTMTPFERDLAYGDEGEDVRRLQAFLNKDPLTQVAQSGDGAPGNETTYFGARTHDAVKRYQALNRNEILLPEGLREPTGYVGARTRAHINAVRQKEEPNKESEQVPDFTEGLPTLDVEEDAVDEVLISNISTTNAAPGEAVTLFGYGFTKTQNEVHFDDVFTVDGLFSKDGRIRVPIPSDTPHDVYNLSVENTNGTSSDYTFLIVREGPYKPPRVSHITPTEGPYGTEVTIHGSGFTEEGNQIRGSYAIINDVPSPDGTTLTFKVKPPIEDVAIEEGEEFGLGQEVPFHFFVVNGNGLSTQPVIFTWNI